MDEGEKSNRIFIKVSKRKLLHGFSFLRGMDKHKSSDVIAGARNMETGRPVQMSRDNVFPPSVFCQPRLLPLETYSSPEK